MKLLFKYEGDHSSQLVYVTGFAHIRHTNKQNAVTVGSFYQNIAKQCSFASGQFYVMIKGYENSKFKKIGLYFVCTFSQIQSHIYASHLFGSSYLYTCVYPVSEKIANGPNCHNTKLLIKIQRHLLLQLILEIFQTCQGNEVANSGVSP